MSLNQQKQNKVKSKLYKKCNECKRNRRFLDKSHRICHLCYKVKTLLQPKSGGNKIIDDFIRDTQVNHNAIMEYVSYDQFKNIEFIAEGGFSKIYKATWVDGPINNWHDIVNDNCEAFSRSHNVQVVLKKLNNSKNITSKELNELKTFYQIKLRRISLCINEFYGITQDPITKDVMIIMPYSVSGDLINYLNEDFHNIDWKTKLNMLFDIARGLNDIHVRGIIHRDLHSGNILFSVDYAVISDFGIIKSATESEDNSNENYGIIPYMAPEIFNKQKYTTASDIYSFGMIMWEFMTGRRPFWDETHDTELIIKICDGLRPPIVTNAPEGYIELMKECWDSDPKKRPTAYDLLITFYDKLKNERKNSTKIIKSPDIGPVSTNNSGSIYKSRPLSKMIQSAMSLRSSRSKSNSLEIDRFYYYQKNDATSTSKRKNEDDLFNAGNNKNGQITKRTKLFKDENSNEYATKEIEFDIDTKFNQHHNEYITKEINIDI